MLNHTHPKPGNHEGVRPSETWYYAVEGLLGEFAQRPQVIAEHVTGLDLFLDLDAIPDADVERARKRLAEALTALDLSRRAAKAS